MSIPAAIKELGKLEHWVTWRIEERDGRPAKVLCVPETGQHASTTNPTTWRTLNEARAKRSGFAGLGFVFDINDPYLGIDLDHCIEDGVVAPWAQELVDQFNTYTEYSPSGTGLHIWVKARKPEGGCRRGDIEIYDRGRYFTVTARPYLDVPIAERQDEVDALHARLFAQRVDTKPRPTPVPLSLSDTEILSRMLTSRNGDAIARLINGDTSPYNGDDSATDLALCNHLAFWTGGDAAAMDRLFRGSNLYRSKWDERRGETTYGQLTIAKALSGATSFYDPDYRSNGVSASQNGTAGLSPSIAAQLGDTSTEQEREHLLPVPLADLYAQADAAGDIEWVVPNLIARGFLHIVTARPGSGKTWAGLTLAHAVAEGFAWGNIHGIAQGRVLWIDEEMGLVLLAKRLRQLEAPDTTPIFTLTMSRFKLDTPEHIEDVRAYIVENNITLVIVDSLRRVHRKKENDNTDMGLLLAPLKSLAQTGAAVIILHHTRKGTLLDADMSEQEMAAGAADIVGMVDMALAMKRQEDAYILYCTKDRLGNLETAPKVGFKLIDAADGTIAIMAVDPKEQAAEERNRMDDRVMDYVKAHPGQHQNYYEANITGAGDAIRQSLKRLVNTGYLQCQKVGRSNVYSPETNRLEDLGSRDYTR